MKKLMIIPIMILVAGLAMWMLNKEYSEIALLTRFLIAVGASLLSGGISYFMFALEERDKKVRGQ